ncbi:MAG: hypothetical protein WAW60_04130, partial [Candidatus Saccharimonadales bacterium]
LRATATTSSRNSLGNALGMVSILPAGTDSPHKLGVNQTLGRPLKRAIAREVFRIMTRHAQDAVAA